MMREKLASFMAGRNGNDQLNLFLYAVDAVLLIAGMFVRGQIGQILYAAFFVLLGLIYFRMFSRNLSKRREENARFLRWYYRIAAAFKIRREKWVQRNGKIKIVCRKCGNSFEGKS